MWEGLIIPTVSTMIFFLFTMNIFKYLVGTTHVHLRDSTKEHNWKSIRRTTTKAFYCSVCENLLLNLDGLLCDSCGVCADRSCIKLADEQLKCKEITYNGREGMKHHWIKGNLPSIAICNVCKEECDTEPGLVDFWCCWCQRCIHDICKPVILETCDFGELKSMIIPPSSLEVTKKRTLRLKAIAPPAWSNWNPLIVVGNRKSGNNDGEEILSMFRRLLNPAQVVDLADRDPIAALQWCKLLGNVPCNVLVAGGDGTVAWLLNSIHKLQLKPEPHVAILPLGTGNDLSRVLNWGKEHDIGKLNPREMLHFIRSGKKVELDRWNVVVKQQSYFMYNYLSIGVDATVALNFHRTRESKFYLFGHRIFNKLLYLCFGTQQVVERECKGLDRYLELYLDGAKVELPALESIVILNIPSWGAGVDLWRNSDEQRIDDGKLEVAALYSSFHIAQLQVGLSEAHRIGQASIIKIKLSKGCPVQIDGEPWYQHPCDINITYCNKASVLKCICR